MTCSFFNQCNRILDTHYSHCHALTVEIFIFSTFGWLGCDSGGKLYVLCFYVLAWYGSQTGTAGLSLSLIGNHT